MKKYKSQRAGQRSQEKPKKEVYREVRVRELDRGVKLKTKREEDR